MKWIIRAYSLGLLAYTGFRTYSFIESQLPASTSGDFMALLFLLATEIGLVLWHEISMRHTTTEIQAGIATGLTWLDFIAATGAGIADMILRQTIDSSYHIPPLLVLVLLYGLPITVALNVAGVLLFLSNDSETVIEREKARLRHEIHKQVLRDLAGSRGAVANSLKRTIATQLREEVTGNTIRTFVNKLDRQEQEQTKPSTPPTNGNGRPPRPKAKTKNYIQ